MVAALSLFSLGWRRSMARPYSIDLRERVLQAHEGSEGSQRVLAERFAVSAGTVCGWLGLARRPPQSAGTCWGTAPAGWGGSTDTSSDAVSPGIPAGHRRSRRRSSPPVHQTAAHT